MMPPGTLLATVLSITVAPGPEACRSPCAGCWPVCGVRRGTKGVKGGHIPYRDSKLTRILQHSLGGNARTAIICTMCPGLMHLEQTRNTLAFALRATEVSNSVRVNAVSPALQNRSCRETNQGPRGRV